MEKCKTIIFYFSLSCILRKFYSRYRGKYGTTTVVLKEIKIQKEYSYELNKEVSILSKLRHPNCVLFLGIFASKYLVMGKLYLSFFFESFIYTF